MTTEQPNQVSISGSMKPFFTIWAGQIFSLLGSELVQFALVWWLTKSTGSATVLAMAAMMAILPRVLISPVAGALVDRWNRRVVMILADGLIALAVIVLAILFALDEVQIWQVYALMFIRATGAAFHWPAMQASTSLMVPEKHLSRIAGLNQSLWGMSSIAAPLLAALLLEVLPMQAILAIDVITAMLAITPLFFIFVPQPERSVDSDHPPQSSIVTDLSEALRYLKAWPGLLMVLVIAMVVNLLAFPAMSLQPLLVTEHFAGGAMQLAWLQTSVGIGLVAGGITLSIWGGFKRRVVTGLSALGLSGLGFAVVGIVPANALPLAIGAMFLAWFMNAIANGSLSAALQAIVPADIQGRVFTLLQSGTGLMVPLGLAIAGPLASALGVQFWFLAAGLTITVMGFGGLLIPTILHIEDDTPELDTTSGIDKTPSPSEKPAAPVTASLNKEAA
jgi:DHA3 family macrolide efflux protein-like MFS transporter